MSIKNKNFHQGCIIIMEIEENKNTENEEISENDNIRTEEAEETEDTEILEESEGNDDTGIEEIEESPKKQRVKRTDEPDFTVDSIYDEPSARDITGLTMSPLLQYGFPVLGVLLLITGVIFLLRYLTPDIGSGFIPAICFCFCGIVLIIMRRQAPQMSVSRFIQRMRQNYGSDSVTMRFMFYPDEIVMSNMTEDDDINFPYDTVTKITKTQKGVIFFLTESRMWFFLHAETFPEGFSAYLKKKCPDALMTNMS